LEVKELNELEELKNDARARHGGRSVTWHFPTKSESRIEAQCKQTRGRIAESTLRVNYFIGTVRMRCGKLSGRKSRQIWVNTRTLENPQGMRHPNSSWPVDGAPRALNESSGSAQSATPESLLFWGKEWYHSLDAS